MKKGWLLFISILFVIVLAACSSGDGESDGNNNDTAGGSQEIYVRVNDDPDFLDPHKATASISFQMILNMFEGLMAPETDGSLKEAIAESYEISEDGLEYTFKIRQGVKFHDGSEVTVDDVKYTFDRLMGTTGGEKMKNNFDNVISTEVVDDSTFKFTLAEPNSNFLYSLTALTSAIIPASNDGKHNENPIGTGPFAYENYSPGMNLVVKKNEDYWREGLPYLNKVTFVFQSDDQAAIMSLLANEVDVSAVPWQRVNEVTDAFNTSHQNNNSSLVVTFNQTKAPFDDVKVRQAIAMAVNKDDIIDSVFSGYAVKLGSNMSPAMGEFHDPSLENMYPFDVEKAKALLAEAGYGDGFSTTITVSSHNGIYSNIAQIVVENLKAIGIDAEIEVVEWGIWLERVYAGRDYEMTAIDLTGRPSAYEVLNDYVSTNDAENFFLFKNAEFDQVMKDVLRETDQAKQVEYYKKAQAILAEQAAAVYIADYQIVWGSDKAVSGLKSYPFWFHDMSEVKMSN